MQEIRNSTVDSGKGDKMSGWGCPHELRGDCMRVEGKPCDPGMKGCVLYGRFTFSTAEKNTPSRQREIEQRPVRTESDES